MAQDQVPSLAPMLERVLPAVVSIAVRGREQEPREREFQAVGSGVIVDPERGHVITNHHVVEGADEITVALSDGRRLQGTKIGADPGTDIAVVRSEEHTSELQSLMRISYAVYCWKKTTIRL